jgi:hypothetical protein
MNQQTNSAQSSLKTNRQSSSWMRKLASLSSIGLLSAGTLGAQTSPDSLVVPAIIEPVPTTEAAPVEVAPVEPAPTAIAEPEQFAPEYFDSAPDLPVATEEVLPEEVPAAPVEEPALSQPDPVIATEQEAPEDGNSAYIDPTNYDLGATPNYDAPSSVVLSERSSGCQAVLEGGQGVSSGVCGAAPAPSLNTIPSGSDTDWRPRSTPTQWASTQWVEPSTTSVQLGPINLSAQGLGVGRTTASGKSYYSAVRPTGRIGNGNIRLIFPISIPAPITSVFGWRIHPISGDSRFHSGTDIGAPMGTPVLAAYTGRVAIADFLGGYGLTVTIDHNKGTQETLYAHLSEIFVKPGEWVEQGAVIGRVGSTGNSTGPHLHFEFRQQTPEGWVAMDAGNQLEFALADLVKSLQSPQTAQAKTPKAPTQPQS